MKEHGNYQIKQAPRMFEQVTQQIINIIASEQLSRGSKIPTERSLGELLKVSRSSIREGIRVLELLKYLDSRQGEGTFVSDPPPFLIPSQVLNLQLDFINLKNYYDIFLMCSEQIVRSSLQDDLLSQHYSSIQNFWVDFVHWIKSLGTQLKNPIFLSLWLNTYELLLENKYFQNFNPSLQINTFIDAFLEKNETKLKEIFHVLSKVN